MPLSIRAKLLIAFAVDLLLMVALGLFAAEQMRVMYERAAFVEAHTVPSLDAVARLTEGSSRYRVQQLEYLIYTNPADKARVEQKMAEIEREMTAHVQSYRPLVNGPDEARRFAEVEAAWGRVVAANHERFIPAARLANTGSVQPFYSRMNPLYAQLDLALGQLSDETRGQASEALAVVRGAYASGRAFIAGDTLLTLVISAGVGLVLSGRIARRIGRLSAATQAVSAGDLEHPVELRGEDELGALARNFNRMVASLREQRGALEQRNAELQASLARQEQLTADLVRGKRAEEEAQRAQAAAEAASQAKSSFLATMSHELRTPLNAILGYAQVLRLSAPQRNLPSDAVEALDRILAAGRHLTTLISNVLDFSKIEQGRVELHISEFDAGAALREAADVVAPLVARGGNELRLDYPPELGRMRSDPGKLRQILINLLGNAAKFTEGGTITLRVTRDEGGGRRDDRVRPGLIAHPSSFILFEVEDTGIGIAPEQLGRLFQPFTQLDDAVTRRYEGTGLGLALSRQLCLALGGDISVASQPGRGSTFTVRLPAEIAPRAELPPAPALPQAAD